MIHDAEKNTWSVVLPLTLQVKGKASRSFIRFVSWSWERPRRELGGPRARERGRGGDAEQSSAVRRELRTSRSSGEIPAGSDQR